MAEKRNSSGFGKSAWEKGDRGSSPAFSIRHWIAWLLLLATTSVEAIDDTSFKVIDSGLWAGYHPRGVVLWLDNERVLFPGNSNFTPAGGRLLMSVWEPKTRKVASYEPWDGVYCVRPNGDVMSVRQVSASPKKYEYVLGPLGAQKPYPPPTPKGYLIEEKYKCDWVKDTRTGNGRSMFDNAFLKRGSLELDPEIPPEKAERNKAGPMHREPFKFFSAPGKGGVSMPFFGGGFIGVSFEYARWRDMYLVAPGQQWKTKPLTHVWWLERSGTVTKEMLPQPLPWPNTAPAMFFPVRDGVVASYGGPKSFSEAGHAGVYWFSRGKAIRVISGAPGTIAVSPSGCRLAMIHSETVDQNLSRKKPYKTLKVIDLCE